MSCRYACMCAGACWSCRDREPEQYFGEAEDLLAQQLGYRSFDDHMENARREEEARQARLDEQASSMQQAHDATS